MHRTDLAGMVEEAAGGVGQVVEVGTRRLQIGRAQPGVGGPYTHGV